MPMACCDGIGPVRARTPCSDSPSTHSIVRNFAVVIAEVERPRHVPGSDAARELHLLPEALEHAGGVSEITTEHLEGDHLVELHVADAVQLPMPPVPSRPRIS